MSKKGPVGWFVNGIALYGLTDGYSYNGNGVWESVAVQLSKYDLDICRGLATASTPYHRT